MGNIGGFKANLALPENEHFFVARLDHYFGDKWHFMTSYRYFNLYLPTPDQVDIGILPGPPLGCSRLSFRHRSSRGPSRT